jgi:transposase
LPLLGRTHLRPPSACRPTPPGSPSSRSQPATRSAALPPRPFLRADRGSRPRLLRVHAARDQRRRRRDVRGLQGIRAGRRKSVYDVLFRAAESDEPSDAAARLAEHLRYEVGCWTHARRGIWEAAVATKSAVAREGLFRIGRIYALEDTWRKKPPEEIKRLRNIHIRPLAEAFFTWAAAEYEQIRATRGLLRTAFGYVLRQKDALMRFLEDGRLQLDNNHSERELRRIAVGRKAWLFVGSDDHAVSTGHLFSLIASARLHRLDPEEYLRDLFRVLGHWPRDRYLELAPKYWAATRARLDAAQLAAEVGSLTIPPPPKPPAEEQAPPR